MERYTLEWLLSLTNKSGDCLLWARALDKDGYPQGGPLERRFKVHREVARLIGHDIVGKVVMHTCDNPSCINPEHLVVGTPGENNLDRAHKGRSHTAAWRALLPSAEALIALGFSNTEIDNLTGVPRRKVGQLRNNKLFKLKVGT